MAKYKDKWKTTFPTSIGNQTRPEDSVDNTQEYNTDGLPQYMANDPVRYDLQNAVNSQLVSNDERLNEKIKRTSDDLAAHNKDPKAHATGIAGNAATASKLLTPRTISLTGKAAGSTSFDGSANAAINVTSVNADTANKLSTARKINITGNASGSAGFDGTSDVSINVSVSQAAHADKATQDTNGRAFTDTNAYMHISALADSTDFNNVKTTGIYYCTGNTYPNRPHNSWGILTVYSIGTVKQEYRPDNEAVYYTREYNNTNWTAWSKVNAANADTATKLATPRAISLTGNASGSANFDGSGNVSISTTVNESKHAAAADSATNADKVDGVHAASLFYNKGNWDANNWATIGTYQVNNNPPVSDAYGWGQVISSSTADARFQLYASDQNNNGRLRYRTGWDNSKDHPWNTILDSENYNLFAPTKTGGGASGTWGINISGNAASATNADKVDGYHASDLLRTLGGNRTPVITDIFDRAGTIDMSTMSAADKAKHKANINKAPNMTQNIWNNSTGIHAYGGDLGIAGYNHGTLKLTQSYKNFDKLMIVYTDDDGECGEVRMFDVYEFNYCMTNMHSFDIFTDHDRYWTIYGLTKHGNDSGFNPSTETVLSCRDQNSGLIGIYGIKY